MGRKGVRLGLLKTNPDPFSSLFFFRREFELLVGKLMEIHHGLTALSTFVLAAISLGQDLTN
jgi:hypothetical protein